MIEKVYFNQEDLLQIIIGSSVLAVPVAFTEESWKLSYTLPVQNLVLIFVLSVLFSTIYAYINIFQKKIEKRLWVFISRIVISYMISLVVVSVILLSLNKLPILSDTIVALKRVIIISFPASMGAIIVDGFDKE